jgi:gliding motility-associated-like protein
VLKGLNFNCKYADSFFSYCPIVLPTLHLNTLQVSTMQLARQISLLLLLLFGSTLAFAQPTAGFTASDVSGCAPLLVQFTDASTGSVSSYSWNLGNSVTTSTQNASTTYSTPGTYTVSLTVTGPTGSNTKTMTIDVYDKPVVSFSATTLAGCVPLSTQFSATVTPNSPGSVSYSWDFGDGFTSSASSPSHSYATPGTYNVALTVRNGAGCATTITRNSYITVYPPPSTNFLASQLIFCTAPATVNFTSTSSGVSPVTASWDFGNGSSGTGTTTSATYTTTGSYPVVLTATDGRGCTGTAVYVVSVQASPASFSTPAVICPGDQALFANTTPGATTSRWNFGDGDTGVGSPIQHQFPPTGSYTVTLTTSVGPCNKTATRTIQISPKPSATITQSPSIICPKPVTVSFTGNSPLAVRYDWEWYNGGIDSGQTVSKSYPGPKNTQIYRDGVRLITTSAVGCKDTVYFDTIKIRPVIVIINPSSLADTPHTAGCAPLTLNLSTNIFELLGPKPVLYPDQGTSWLWNFGDGGTGAGSNPIHTFVSTGDYVVRSIVTTINGCTDTGYLKVHVDTPVHPSFFGFPLTPICPKDSVTFFNTTDTPLSNTLYTWYTTGSGFVQKYDTSWVRLAFNFPGYYDVHLDTDHRGCIEHFTRTAYINVKGPGAHFKDSALCAPSTTVYFKNDSYQATSFSWDFGDGVSSTLPDPVHTYATQGVYVARIFTANSNTGCVDTFEEELDLRPSLLVIDSVEDRSICRGEQIAFRGGYGYNREVQIKYAWRTDNTYSPFDTSRWFYHVYNTKGIYDVTLYTLSHKAGCVDSLVFPAYVSVAQPVANFSAIPPVGCQPLNVLFSDSTMHIFGVKSSTLEWQFGDGSTSTVGTNTVNHIYNARGLYTVKLVATDNFGCKDSLTRVNYISVRRPQANFKAADTAVCARQFVNFSSLSTLPNTLRHHWNFGDGDTANTVNPSHRYISPGTYTVKLAVTDSSGCSDTLTLIGYIKIKAPHASFTMDDSLGICPPLLVKFTNTSTGAITNAWDLGTGNPLTNIDTPSRSYAAAGVYNVQLVATDPDNCTDTARGTIRILGYSGAFSYTPLTGCIPMTVSFSTSVLNVPQYVWDFSDGSTAITTTNSVSHTYTSLGSYMPKLIFTDGPGCSALSLGLDSIRVDDFHAAFTHSVPCVGVPFTLTDSSYGYRAKPSSWSWLFGLTDGGSGTPIAYTAASSGPMIVTLLATNSIGCKDTIAKSIFVNDLPVVDAGLDTNVCPGDTVQLSASGALTYAWSAAPINSLYFSCRTCATSLFSLGTSPQNTVYVSGTDANGCIGRDSLQVNIQLKTSTSTGPGGEICAGQSFRLHAEGAQSYTWLPFGTIDSPFIASPLATPTSTTTYIVAAREGSCLVDSQSVTVVVHDLPPFDAGYDEIIRFGSAALLKPTQNGIHHIIWRTDSTLSCLDCFNPAASPEYTRTYWATAYNEFGCSVTDSVTVHVLCTGDSVYIPNTFTPNGDGQNDYFFPRGKGIQRAMFLRVYDRWGELVYEQTNLALNDERSGWNGSYRGKALPPDTYVYVMQSRCPTGEYVRWKGDVTLIR